MKKTKPEFDICVIGGGAGGLVVAAGGATLGAKVALVEKHELGGDCLHFGCVPSKSLIHSAKTAQIMRTADKAGIDSHAPDISISKVMKRVAGVIDTIAVNDSPERFRNMGIEVLFGNGRFTKPDTFQVNNRNLTAKYFVLATGSRPAIPPIAGLNSTPFLTNESIFSLDEQVPHLIVLGGGPIGIEMAQAFSRLGSKVSVVELAEQLLPREDGDLTAILADQLRQEGISLHLNTMAVAVEGETGNIRLKIKSKDNNEDVISASHLLVAAGRRANIEGLDLDAAAINIDNGRIITDRRLRTSNRRVFACGDVVGPYQFTHMAEHQAGVVLRNIIFRLPAKIEQRVIPWCTFTDPEFARVGLSETEAREQAIPFKVYTFPFNEIDRAHAEGETIGMAKIITEPKGKLLGAALLGPHAGELIHEYILAIAKGMKTSDLSRVIHIYPTLSQINRRVADARLKESLTPNRKYWIKTLFGLRGK